MSKFVSPAIASKELGLSASYLRELARSSQDWKYGVHYRDVRSPMATRASYQYCIEEINKWFAIKPEKRG